MALRSPGVKDKLRPRMGFIARAKLLLHGRVEGGTPPNVRPVATRPGIPIPRLAAQRPRAAKFRTPVAPGFLEERNAMIWRETSMGSIPITRSTLRLRQASCGKNTADRITGCFCLWAAGATYGFPASSLIRSRSREAQRRGAFALVDAAAGNMRRGRGAGSHSPRSGAIAGPAPPSEISKSFRNVEVVRLR